VVLPVRRVSATRSSVLLFAALKFRREFIPREKRKTAGSHAGSQSNDTSGVFVDAIENGRRTMAPRGEGATGGWPDGGQHSHTDKQFGDPATDMSGDYRVSVRQVVGAWLILLSAAGLGLALTAKHMDLAGSASAAAVSPAASGATRYPLAGVRNPGSVFNSRARETRVETDEPDSQERQRPAEDGC
jgi:hypothetical protein